MKYSSCERLTIIWPLYPAGGLAGHHRAADHRAGRVGPLQVGRVVHRRGAGRQVAAHRPAGLWVATGQLFTQLLF